MTTPKTEIRVSADLISAPSSAVARRVAWTPWAAALVLAAVAIVLVIGTLSTPAPQADFVRGSNALFAVAWATIGARIAARHPRNAVGWLLLATGITFGFAAVIVEAIIARSFGADFVDAGIRLNQVLSFILPLTAGLTVLLFPDGRLASPAWLPVLVILVASHEGLAGLDGRLRDEGDAVNRVRHPLAVPVHRGAVIELVLPADAKALALGHAENRARDLAVVGLGVDEIPRRHFPT